jgi:hypothetical protein
MAELSPVQTTVTAQMALKQRRSHYAQQALTPLSLTPSRFTIALNAQLDSTVTVLKTFHLLQQVHRLVRLDTIAYQAPHSMISIHARQAITMMEQAPSQSTIANTADSTSSVQDMERLLQRRAKMELSTQSPLLQRTAHHVRQVTNAYSLLPIKSHVESVGTPPRVHLNAPTALSEHTVRMRPRRTLT